MGKLVVFILLSLTSVALGKRYEVTCRSGTELKGSYVWTDQQVEGTTMAIFTCCPTNKPSAYFVNENFFCCPKDIGAYCMSNRCNCKSGGKLSGGKQPNF